jgi:hypothetical protein
MYIGFWGGKIEVVRQAPLPREIRGDGDFRTEAKRRKNCILTGKRKNSIFLVLWSKLIEYTSWSGTRSISGRQPSGAFL